MSYETVTVTCSQHRRHCAVAESPRGGGMRIRHAGPGDTDLCTSQRFTVRTERQVDPGGAWAELLRLDMLAEAQASLGTAPENESAATAAPREDEGS